MTHFRPQMTMTLPSWRSRGGGEEKRRFPRAETGLQSQEWCPGLRKMGVEKELVQDRQSVGAAARDRSRCGGQCRGNPGEAKMAELCSVGPFLPT